MPILKGQEIGGYVNITRNVKFSGAVIAGRVSPSPWSTIYYVDGLSGASTNDGLSPGKAFDTIQAALTLGGRGTVIYVRPQTYKIGTGFNRYTEDLTLALGGAGGNAVVATNSDISLIGVTNTISPEFGVRLRATTIGLTCDAPSLHIENIGFFTEGATYGLRFRSDGTTYTQRGADGTTLYNCVIKGPGIYIYSGGDGFTVDNCLFHTSYDGATGGIGCIYQDGGAIGPAFRTKILNCKFHGGNITEQPATAYITLVAPVFETIIAHNIFGRIPSDAHYINATGSTTTGMIVDNFFAHDDILLETDLHISGMVQAGNWDTGGIVV